METNRRLQERSEHKRFGWGSAVVGPQALRWYFNFHQPSAQPETPKRRVCGRFQILLQDPKSPPGLARRPWFEWSVSSREARGPA
ncbi:MAG: hypothetical protein GY847_37445 [Proteobacteria bacterium]|nr:hypothetical protein [Pseudomonadota bacterium]